MALKWLDGLEGDPNDYRCHVKMQAIQNWLDYQPGEVQELVNAALKRARIRNAEARMMMAMVQPDIEPYSDPAEDTAIGSTGFFGPSFAQMQAQKAQQSALQAKVNAALNSYGADSANNYGGRGY